jgi:hypothetical protein
MKQPIITGLMLAAALTLTLPSLGRSARRAQPQPAASDDDSGKWGVGYAYLPSRSGALDALSATYRLNPNLDLDGMLLGGIGSVYNGGTSASGGVVNDGVSNFGLAAQGRLSLAHPTQDLAFQVVGRLSYVTESTTHTVLGNAVTTSDGLIGLFAGFGFEGFIPSWRAVSIEVNSGFNVFLTGVSAAGTGANEMSAYLGASNANAFVPFNLAVHYYF